MSPRRQPCCFTLGSKPGVLKPVGESIRVGVGGRDGTTLDLNIDAAELLFHGEMFALQKLLSTDSECSQAIPSGLEGKESTKQTETKTKTKNTKQTNNKNNIGGSWGKARQSLWFCNP